MIRLITSAAKSPVFANLLMLVLIAAGLRSVMSIRREMFPEFSFDVVTVTAIYPGATPAEIERSVTIKLEESVRGLEGVYKVESTAAEGYTTVRVEVDSEVADPRDVLVDIRNEVSRITSFPEDVEDPEVELRLNRRDVMTVALVAAEEGALREESLTTLARDLEEELLLLPDVSEVTVYGVRPREIAVEVCEEDLQSRGLAFADITRAIRQASLDLPIGKLRSGDEEQLLRVQRQRQVGRELLDIPVVSRPDGTRIVLGDIARVSDAFDEDRVELKIDGKRAVMLTVGKTRDQDTIRVAEAVKAWIAEKQGALPRTVTLSAWQDGSIAVTDRLSLLSKNGLQGLALVFIVLVVFLGLRLSFWVALGLPVAFLTAMVLLEGFGGSLNMISSFGLIMVLGILVDDSIVVAENVARHMQERGHTLAAAIDGLKEVAWPVTASVTTTAVAFLPLFYIGGVMGKFIRIMPVAVVACLIASLIECLLILPAHLAHGRPPSPRETGLKRLRREVDAWTDRFIERRYGASIDWALRNRYVVLALSAGAMIVTLGLVVSGRPGFVFFPRLDSQFIEANILMPQGTPIERTQAVVDRVYAATQELKKTYPVAADGLPIIRRVLTRVGEGGAQKASVRIELARSSQRDIKAMTIVKNWQELSGEFPEARSVTMAGTRHRPGGRPIEIRIMASDQSQSAHIAEDLRAALTTYPGVFNIQDNLEPGKRELRFDLKPAADVLGIGVADMARQLYAGFSGEEAYTIQRGRDEVEVRVRYEANLRCQPEQLADLRLRTERGLLPLSWAADIERGRSLSRIERRDGRRVVTLTADVDDGVTNARNVNTSLREKTISELEQRYPGTLFVFGGQEEEEATTLSGLALGFALACLGIYGILALLFNSYVQPVIVMMVIPLGFGGAILGHLLLGLPIMIFSVFGMVGLTGIVVNDALVLIDFINRRRRSGTTPLAAAAAAGRVRFRAVFLTTVTTVVGLLPIMLESSLQAQFVIPMALSISAGVAAATILTLYAVPCAYLAVDDLRGLFFVPAEARAAPALLESLGGA